MRARSCVWSRGGWGAIPDQIDKPLNARCPATRAKANATEFHAKFNAFSSARACPFWQTAFSVKCGLIFFIHRGRQMGVMKEEAKL